MGRRGRFDGSLVAIGVVALVGLAWRVGYTIDQFRGDHQLFDEGDAVAYSTTAHNTARGHWFEHAFYGTHFADHPPLTVASLVPTGWLFPDSVMAQRYTFCLLGAVAIVLIGLLARSLAGPVAGVAAAVVAAANPNLWMNDAVIMSESISTVLIAGLLWACVGLRRAPTLPRACLVGALCGLTILARAEIGLFLPLLIIPAIVLGGELRRRDRILRAGAAVLMAALVVAPWTLWNTAEFDEPVLISTNDGTTLLGANCPRTYSGSTIGSWSIQCVVEFNDAAGTEERHLDASEVSTEQRHEGVAYIRDNLGRVPKVVYARLGRTFGWWEIGQQVYINQGEGRPKWASWAGYWSFWALIPVSIAGAVALRRRRADLLPAAATLVTVVLVSAAFYGISRFRLPLDVMTCVLAGAAVSALVERRRAARSGAADPDEPRTDPEVSGTPASAATVP
ncbi:MAG TPA: glycosyltransferase family 39 protein [Iamia sp.]|nr:glycosyltransferase family 39 protein [Iamia sp.]